MSAAADRDDDKDKGDKVNISVAFLYCTFVDGSHAVLTAEQYFQYAADIVDVELWGI